MADRDAWRIGGRVFQILQLGYVALGWIVEREPSIIAQLQDRHRREALRHRRDAEDGVRIDWRFRRYVAHTERAGMRQLAVDDDAPGAAWDMRALSELAEETIDVGEAALELRAPLRIRELRSRRDRRVNRGG